MFSSDENHYLGVNANAGWLYLTSNELIIPINDIINIQQNETLSHLPFGLSIIDNLNNHQFLVVKLWMKKIG